MLSAGTLKFGPNIKATDSYYDNSKDYCYENLIELIREKIIIPNAKQERKIK